MSVRTRSCLALLLLLGAVTGHAAEPASATISPAAPATSFESGPFLTSGGVFCSFTDGCDSYELNVELPADYAMTNPQAQVRIGLGWDFKLDLFTFTLTDIDSGEAVVTSDSTDLGSMTLYFPAGSGSRHLRLDITPLAANNSVVFGRVSLEPGNGDGLLPNPIGAGIPRYQVYAPPEGLSGNTGEPSVGYNPLSKQSFILSGLKTLFLKYPQDLEPAQPQACDGEWENRSSPLTSVTTLDPIGVTDSLVRGHETGRTWIGQLAGANSVMAYSDDDGATWIPNQGGPFASAVDHQTIAAGPYPPPLDAIPNPLYPNAFYYCGQDIAFASCARSDNGGLTFGAPTPVYTVAQCAGIHGHVRVAPDGTVYLPSKACGPNVAISVSTDAASTWTQRPVPDSAPAIRDPSVAIATDNTAYFCYSDGDRNARVAVTKDRGATWERVVDVGKDMGIKHVMFTHAIAGDGDRATCAYVGTNTEGNPVSLDFPGVWYLYFSTTYDGGQTWTTINATPNDPVQGFGGIWNSGGGNPNRNLLDFNEISIDAQGYPLYGYADGCIGACDRNPSLNPFAAFPKIARQVGGKPLYAEFDPVEPRAPANACLAGSRTPERTQLTWKPPENGGAAISQYRVFRGTAPGTESFVGTTAGTPGYVDLTADPTVEKYYYKVTAVNAQGEGIASNTVELPIVVPEAQTSCAIPGLRLVTDAVGDGTLDGADLISLSIAEPPDAADKLIVQIKVASLAAPVPTGMYTVLFHTPDQPLTNPNDRFVGMVSDGAQMSFVYGSRTETVVAVAVVQQYTVEGTLDPASSATDDGTISLVVPRALFDLKDGDLLAAVSANVHVGALAQGTHIVRSTNVLDSAEASDPYELRAGDFCRTNTAPTARLAVTPAKGGAPLMSMLDASASSDAEDSLIEYVFDPGDGTPQVVQSSPRLAHSYTRDGNYRASLQVRDSRGLVSPNVAAGIVEVAGSSGSSSGGSSGGGDGEGRFGGAFGLSGLFALLLLAMPRIRRRRLKAARGDAV
ncbi:PKD domain-containing protein [Brevundimonas sp.]|uniref:PKD domain-containing protein n=1 Tax=Brevundimonas sp. TaxID=1871086 RepID=UPI00273780F0|nr:PKD domain-containing protein [Brevundimonas sp.]MDP3803209.1 PKD domain-containing protein [Brevundimonas sp.]